LKLFKKKSKIYYQKIILNPQFMVDKKLLFQFGEKFKKKEFRLNKSQTLLDSELF